MTKCKDTDNKNNTNENNSPAIASLICALIAPFTMGLTTIPAIILGHIGLNTKSKKIAIGGLVIGYSILCVIGFHLILSARASYIQNEIENNHRLVDDGYTVKAVCFENVNTDSTLEERWCFKNPQRGLGVNNVKATMQSLYSHSMATFKEKNGKTPKLVNIWLYMDKRDEAYDWLGWGRKYDPNDKFSVEVNEKRATSLSNYHELSIWDGSKLKSRKANAVYALQLYAQSYFEGATISMIDFTGTQMGVDEKLKCNMDIMVMPLNFNSRYPKYRISGIVDFSDSRDGLVTSFGLIEL